MEEIQNFLKKKVETKEKIIFAGDFNMDTIKSSQFLKKSGVNFDHARVSNSLGSRWNKNVMGRMIDHIFYCGIGSRPNQCTANKYIDISDHFPITAEWDLAAMDGPPLKRKINLKKIELVKDQLISSNRFELLATDRIDINQSSKELIDIIWDESDRLGAVTDLADPADQKKIFLSNKTIKKIMKKQKVFKLLTKDKINLDAYVKAKNDAEKSKKLDSKKFYEKKLLKLNEYITTNEPKKMWEFIKYSTGKFKSNTSAGPVLDIHKNLIVDSESRLKVWENHFKNLATDTTGNSRTADKWEPMLDYDIESFPECDEPIKWSEITTALKEIPNNKASGTDGIPNEVWKLIKSEISPTSKMAKIVFKILKSIWDTGNIPEIMSTSIVVPVPKKGNLSDPNNYRGISLIPTFIKILAKVLANKLSAISEKYKIIAKEQGGFRTREECVSQATILYEIVKRRKLMGLETWIGFIDFSKAYDLVPHMALIYKLRNMGIGGKILKNIKGLYDAPKLTVRIGDKMTGTFDYKCGDGGSLCAITCKHGGVLTKFAKLGF
ncbi:LINE-1 reverse transcriptase-like protein [Smittium mucronatum]|uniref:LINE-1 reverse transcriptase-like protein n=1 Tax=Smittium mucronatum TaxID=133383 RepID=A0A1R0GS88_9FUNG|nr:LINE-1 reverse transcriptase-like protein [Smittium mucronatum]